MFEFQEEGINLLMRNYTYYLSNKYNLDIDVVRILMKSMDLTGDSIQYNIHIARKKTI